MKEGGETGKVLGTLDGMSGIIQPTGVPI